VNGPTLDRALIEKDYPSGSLLRNTGATWDSQNRHSPYTDQLTAGYERQLAANLAVSADYVHSRSRDLLMTLNLNPQLRSNPNVNNSTLTRIGSPTLSAAMVELQSTYPGFAPFTGNVNQIINAGRVNYDALMLQINKRYSDNYSARLSYTYSHSRGNTGGGSAPGSGFQVGDDMHLELNEGPSDFDIPHNLTFSGTALVPATLTDLGGGACFNDARVQVASLATAPVS
jgi:hypothetical protein